MDGDGWGVSGHNPPGFFGMHDDGVSVAPPALLAPIDLGLPSHRERVVRGQDHPGPAPEPMQEPKGRFPGPLSPGNGRRPAPSWRHRSLSEARAGHNSPNRSA